MTESILSLHKLFFSPPRPEPLKVSSIVSKNCVLGGTFDKFHFGHQAFINSAFNIAEKVHVCIMSDEGVRLWGKKKYSDMVDPYNKRLATVKDFLIEYGLLNHAVVCKIDDPYSYATKRSEALYLDSILVSTEDIILKRTLMLNNARRSKGLKPLHIFRMPLIIDKDGVPISATRIRAGEKIYFPSIPTFRISKELIPLIREPKGELVNSPKELPEPEGPVIAIGDIVVQNLVKYGYPISIAIIDKRSRRESIEDYYLYFSANNGITDIPPYIPVKNPRGHISNDTWTKLILALFQSSPVVVRVYGEEDLLGFPATILAPNKTLVIFGQPPPWDKLVYFFVDDSKRAEAYNLLMRMQKIKE